MGIGLRPLCPIDIIFRISRSLLCPHLTELTLWGAKVWRNANDSAASYLLPGHNSIVILHGDNILTVCLEL